MAEVQDALDDVPVQKEKKPRTDAQIAAWEKAQKVRIERAQAKKDNKVAEYVEKKIETLKKKLPAKKPAATAPPAVVQEVNSETDEEEEPEVVVVRVPPKSKPKPKPKPKKQIRVELEEEEFSEDDEPLVKPKVPPRQPPPKPVQKESPVGQPRIYFV